MFLRAVRAAAAFALVLSAVFAQPVAGQQQNIVFKNVPDFLRLKWEIVLGADAKGEIVRMPGFVIAGNQCVLISTKSVDQTAGDFRTLDGMTRVVQYNIERSAASSGYITLFHLRGEDSEVILRPGQWFWTISVRNGHSGPYASYVGLLAGHEKELRDAGMFDRELEGQRKVLKELYLDYTKGLDDR
jgi:hypothetical protein